MIASTHMMLYAWTPLPADGNQLQQWFTPWKLAINMSLLRVLHWQLRGASCSGFKQMF